MAKSKGNLIIQSDNRKLMALLRVLPAVVILTAAGIAVLVVCIKMNSSELASFIDNALNGTKLEGKISAGLLFGSLGVVGIVIPLLFVLGIVISALKEASMSYIDVYEQAVYGRFMVPDERGITYCNAFLSYDKVKDVDSRGKKVYVWTGNACLEAIAFNAKHIRNEIELRSDFRAFDKKPKKPKQPKQ